MINILQENKTTPLRTPTSRFEAVPMEGNKENYTLEKKQHPQPVA
jgi:hypothetical protein